MKKFGVFALTALGTLGVLAGGVAIVANAPKTKDKLHISWNNTNIVGKPTDSTGDTSADKVKTNLCYFNDMQENIINSVAVDGIVSYIPDDPEAIEDYDEMIDDKPNVYSFAGWSTELGNADKIVDLKKDIFLEETTFYAIYKDSQGKVFKNNIYFNVSIAAEINEGFSAKEGEPINVNLLPTPDIYGCDILEDYTVSGFCVNDDLSKMVDDKYVAKQGDEISVVYTKDGKSCTAKDMAGFAIVGNGFNEKRALFNTKSEFAYSTCLAYLQNLEIPNQDKLLGFELNGQILDLNNLEAQINFANAIFYLVYDNSEEPPAQDVICTFFPYTQNFGGSQIQGQQSALDAFSANSVMASEEYTFINNLTFAGWADSIDSTEVLSGDTLTQDGANYYAVYSDAEGQMFKASDIQRLVFVDQENNTFTRVAHVDADVLKAYALSFASPSAEGKTFVGWAYEGSTEVVDLNNLTIADGLCVLVAVYEAA